MPVLPTIQSATSADRAAMIKLLHAVNLPTADLPAALDNFVIVKHNNAVIGSCGLEVFGSVALLRSLAVAPDFRSRGLGNSLVGAALKLVQNKGVKQVFLITNTAAPFFKSQGFTEVDRATVPTVIQGTAQFSFVCPASATILYQEIS